MAAYSQYLQRLFLLYIVSSFALICIHFAYNIEKLTDILYLQLLDFLFTNSVQNIAI